VRVTELIEMPAERPLVEYTIPPDGTDSPVTT
jgi:hypothetical protein